MKSAAAKDNISIEVVSAYRSFERQKEIFEGKYKRFTGQGLSPSSRPQLVDGARGARNCVPKVKVARGAVTPSCSDALILSVHLFCSGPPPKTPDTPLPRFIGSLLKNPKCQKARPCCPADQAATTTVAAAVNSRAPTQPTHIALALRSEISPTFVLAWQRNRSANNGMLLPHHISPPILAPPCSCFASAYRIRLRQRCLIIATRPRPVCSESTVVPLSPLDRIPV